jgi:hypothetical protein
VVDADNFLALAGIRKGRERERKRGAGAREQHEILESGIGDDDAAEGDEQDGLDVSV